VEFDSFRLFGGIVILATAYLFIVHGRKSFLDMKSTLDEMAQQLALPFMVGA
jgi:multiple antibiotic resistance protein